MSLSRLPSFRSNGIFFRHPLTAVGSLLIASVVLVTYFPSLNIGFWMDDLINIDMAGRFSGPEYIAKAFDPRLQRLWYRPLIVMEWKIGYTFFRGDPVGYHFVQVLLHLIACLLLFALAKRATHSLRIGLVAGLIYAALPLASMAVYWPSVHDPLTACFYLLTLWFWLEYLESGNHFKFLWTIVAFIGALLSKEISVTLPFLLVLIDWLLVRKPITVVDFVKRYAPFVVILAVYAPLELIVISRSLFTQQIGYGIGWQIIPVFFHYLSYLAFPWELDQNARFAFLAAILIVCAVIVLKRDRRILILAVAGILPVLIVAPIPEHLFNPRYLYLPLMVTAIGLSLLVETALRAIRNLPRVWINAAMSLCIVFIVATGSASINEQTVNHGGFIRELRLLFRPIYQRHATFPPDTLLYFLDTPLQSLDISGLMFLRYGANVTVSGVDRREITNLRDHRAAFVFYLDNKNVFQEQPVDPNSTAQITPAVPVQFQKSISLQAFDIASAQVKRGEAVVILLYWKASERIDKDYTVFAHLVDAHGNMIAGVDRQPRKGLAPTHEWNPNSLVGDSVILPITSDIPVGKDYKIEIGLYDQTTMQRLQIVDAMGNVITDRVTIAPLSVSE
jgi:hypothetical protein